MYRIIVKNKNWQPGEIGDLHSTHETADQAKKVAESLGDRFAYCESFNQYRGIMQDIELFDDHDYEYDGTRQEFSRSCF